VDLRFSENVSFGQIYYANSRRREPVWFSSSGWSREERVLFLLLEDILKSCSHAMKRMDMQGRDDRNCVGGELGMAGLWTVTTFYLPTTYRSAALLEQRHDPHSVSTR